MQSSDVLMLANGFQSSGSGGSAALNDRSLYSGDFEVAMDPASSMILSTDNQKHEDLRKMLDGNKENMKLAAMKRIINMVARGKDCSDLFAAVVKNVVSKDPELKKLVYVYLTRYAEEQQDLALLSIATFQKSLKDPNQLIRACALRVLSSIRVPVIVPILMLAIRDAAADLSPYVRKTAAHAIPKLFSLDPEEKETLIEVIDKLLADKSTLVAGSAVQAFEEVCPDRFDLIHRHFRKLCNLLMDVEEWGQVVILGMLTRYARMQFPNPAAKSSEDSRLNKETPPTGASTNQPAVTKGSTAATGTSKIQEKDDEETEAEDEEEEEEEDEEEGKEEEGEESEDMKTESSEEEEEEADANEQGSSPAGMSPAEIKSLTILHADYRLLISSCRLLLLNRNSAVVMATAQLLYYCATKQEMPSVVRALLRILHSTKHVQHVVLANIATISLTYPELFEPHLRSFFVFNSDHTQVKLFKLEILTNLITESTAPVILREFQSYVNSSDPEFVATTIQCIGRGASTVPQIAETCLTGLLRLMSRKNERIVAESVIVMRKLLQMQLARHRSSSDLIVHIAQMVDGINIPSARASILWLLGEYSQRVPRIAPDVLRKVAKTFPTEDVAVKLQILNLAAKLYMYNPRQTELLAQYVFTLAKYDQNYDIRDRSRFFRALIFPNQVATEKTACSSYLFRNAKKILLATKPAPVLRSQLYGRPELNLGSMSHLLGRKISGYKDLPDWPLVPPDPLTREVVEPTPSQYSGQEGSVARTSTSQQPGSDLSSWRSDAQSDEEGSLCTESDEDLQEEDEEGEEEEEEQDQDESDQGASQETDNEEEAVAGEAPSNGRRRGRTSSSTDSSYAEFSASRPATRRQQPVRRKPPSPDITESATESESEVQQQQSDWIDLAPVKHQSNGRAGASKKISVKTEEKQPSEDLLLLDFDAPAPMPSGQAAPGVGNHQGSGLLVPTPVHSAISASHSTSTASVLPPGETKLQLPSTPDTDINSTRSGEWFGVTPPFSEPLYVEARFLRTISVFGQPGQVNMELRLTNRSLTQSTLFHVCARLPTDTTKAHCSESFPEIPSLPYGANSVVFFGVNFCESTQPVRFGLMYQLSTVDDELAKPITLDVSIKPPVGELFQPLDMKVLDFVAKQATLKGMHTTTMSLASGSAAVSKFSGAANAARAVQVIIKAANLAFLGATLKSPESEEESEGKDAGIQLFTAAGTIILRFAGRSASGQQDCLVELRLPAQEEEAPDVIALPARASSALPCPGLRVHTEAMSLGLQLAKELVDCILASV
nr:unnamed protein product [Spirometra erinaceieuropaei]